VNLDRKAVNQHYLAPFLIATVLSGLLNPAPALARKPPQRIVKVGVAVTSEVKENKTWKSEFERRLGYSSRIFESEFNVKFKVQTYMTWNPKVKQQTMNALINDLQGRFALDKMDILIGLTQLEKTQNRESLADLHALGIARPFSGYMVVRYPKVPLYRVQEETVMTHELGHLFGAVHTNIKETVMAPIVVRQIPTRFDDANHDIIMQTRAVIFGKGIDAVSGQTAQQLIRSYKKMEAIDQKYDFYYSLGIFYLKLDQKDEAIRAWKAAAREPEAHARLYYDLGVLQANVGQDAEAVRHLTKAVSRFNTPQAKQDKIAAQKLIGTIYFKQRDYNGAYHSWNRALLMDPRNMDLKMNVAMAQMIRGQVDDAIRVFRDALDLDRSNAKVLSNLAYAYLKKGENKKAIHYLEQALRNAPKQTVQGVGGPMFADQPSEILRNLGLAYMGLENYKEAAKYLSKSCQMNSTTDCHENLGKLYFKIEKWDQCIGELAGVLPQRKEDANLYGILGVCMTRGGRSDQALALFQEGLKNIKDSGKEAQFHKNIGNLYLERGKWDLARFEFERAISKNGNDPDSHVGRAMAYMSLNRFYDAQQSLRRALTIRPQHQNARNLLSQVEARLG